LQRIVIFQDRQRGHPGRVYGRILPEQVPMIDPKQGPLLIPGRGADPSKPTAPVGAGSEIKDAGKRPCAPKRHFSLLGS
jgi:hypothetical protein